MVEPIQHPAPPRPRRLPFYALLAAQAISFAGNALAGLALPWFVLQTTGSAARVGLVAFCALLPQVLAATFGGAFVDRLGHRRASVAADLASGIAVALVPLLYALGWLNFGLLLVLVFGGALLDAPGATARAALFPELIMLARLRPERANTAHEIVESGAGLAGPLLAGVLIAALGPTLVLWGNAASFLLSAALVLGCVPRLRGAAFAADNARYRETLVRGFRFVLRDPVIRGIFVIGAPLNLMIAPLFAVILPFYIQTSGDNALNLGATIGAFGGGAVLGALAYGAVGHRWPRRITFLIGVFAIGSSFAVVAALPSVPIMIASLFLSGLISGPNGPLINTILQECMPPELRGSVFGATTAIGYASGPLGVLLAGVLLQAIGTRPTLLGATALFLAVALALTFDRGLRELDRPSPLLLEH
jgi:MFS family permease